MFFSETDIMRHTIVESRSISRKSTSTK